MHTFTLDTNCIVAIDECRPEARAIRALADAHEAGKAQVALVAISASEKQKNGAHLASFNDFQARLSALGLSRLEVLKPMAYWDIAFFDWALWVNSEMEALERTIYDILFPNIPFHWSDYCSAHRLDVTQPFSAKWRNSKCDVQALWSHIHHGRSVFVTSDRNFHAATKHPALLALGAGKIKFPSEAAAMLS